MKIKKITTNSILLAIGLILHQITPTLGLPMQPDFALAMLFIVMMLNKDDYKTCVISAIVTGIFTALTTKFPGGQIPNLLDKVITANFIYLLMFMFYKIKLLDKFLKSKKESVLAMIILPFGTLVSGTIFLISAKAIVGLPAPFLPLFLTVVLPTCIINLFVGIFLYNIVNLSLKRSFRA
ncbi:tryptophan transporter [Romboutsia sp. 1001285H_161024_C4]|uniref:tryptophan transporter n=1 Tax=Romboutsia sp. 1001285H_161024_C4 TaxID=2787109 RepID=UPI00189B4581|nr:tryptophan transporter [Romboutsia sp. 1001285H_161024_C4]